MIARFSRNSRRLIWLAAGLLLLLVFIAVLPEIMRYGAVSLLKQQGVQKVTIRDIDFNPFSGEFELRGLKSTSGLSLDHVKLRLDWWPLWHQRLAITEFKTDHLNLSIREGEDGSLTIGNITLPAANDSTESAPSAWHVSLPEAEISHVTLSVRLAPSKGEKARTIRLKLDRMQLHGLALASTELRLTALQLDALNIGDSAQQLPKEIGRIALTNLTGDPNKTMRLAKAEIDAVVLAPPAPLQGGSVKQIAARGIELATNGDVSAASIRVNGTTLPDRNGAHLGSIDTIGLEEMQLRQSAGDPLLKAKQVALAGITLPADKTLALGRIKDIRADAVEADGHHAAMQTLTVAGLEASVLRQKRGAIVIPGVPTRTAGAKPSNPANASTPFSLRIGTMATNGDNRIEIRDEVVKPAFKTRIDILRFSLAPLSIGKAEKGKLTATLRLNRQGILKADGWLTPDPSQLAMNLHASITNLGLPRFSSYVEKEVGVAIHTGKLDLDTTAKVADGMMHAKNRVHIRDLQVKAETNAVSVNGIPIDMALDMIRDDRGDIKLTVPLDGPLNDLKAGISDVVNKAMMTAVQKAALIYAAQSLYPYGVIIPAFSALKKLANAQPALTPIQFASRSDKLDEQATAYTAKIAELLKSKQKIRLQVCGIAATAEFPAGQVPRDEKLLDLAQHRSSQIVHAIAGHGINPERLFACNPAIDHAQDAKGRVELLLK